MERLAENIACGDMHCPVALLLSETSGTANGTVYVMNNQPRGGNQAYDGAYAIPLATWDEHRSQVQAGRAAAGDILLRAAAGEFDAVRMAAGVSDSHDLAEHFSYRDLVAMEVAFRPGGAWAEDLPAGIPVVAPTAAVSLSEQSV